MFVYLILISASCVSAAEIWTYEEQNTWPTNYTSCGGKRQSPINIDTRKLKRSPSLRLYPNNYDKYYKNITVKNNGHTALISLNNPSVKPSLDMWNTSNTFQTYVFEQMHFHWGEDNMIGSEHCVDKQFAAAELHLVHYNKKFATIDDAINQPDGLLVLTVLLGLSRYDNPAIQSIVEVLPQVINYESSAVAKGVSLSDLIPRDTRVVWKYLGSLTTPPCSETATFVIFEDTITISPYQTSQFRRLLTETKSRISENTRDLQSLNDRIVEVTGT